MRIRAQEGPVALSLNGEDRTGGFFAAVGVRDTGKDILFIIVVWGSSLESGNILIFRQALGHSMYAAMLRKNAV